MHNGGSLTITRSINGRIEVVREIPAVAGYPRLQSRTGSSYDGSSELRTSQSQPEIISNLIVSTKMHQTENAIYNILPSINEQTNILLLQNGMGSYEKLCTKFWPDRSTRPKFLMGITTHGVRKAAGPEWKFNHVGQGTLKLAPLPSANPASKELGELLLKTGLELDAEVMQYEDFIIAQFEKLVCNCIINPLTALYDCYNGEVFSLESFDFFAYKVINEAVAAFSAEINKNFGQMKHSGKLGTALHVDRLMALVVEVAKKTADNRSSMLQDIQVLQDTEIDYLNGYIVQLAKKHGTGAIHNRMLIELVKSKLSLDKDRDTRQVPFVNI